MNIKLLQTLRNYNKDNFIKDIIAGIIIMAVSIPISMGYAQIAGLPAVYGLYGSVFPILVFGLFSTSPQFIFGVDAAPAALVGSALLTLNIEAGSDKAMAAVPVMTFFVALWLLAFYFMKAGKLVNYISAPVMGGFITGICTTIILMQIPKVMGGTSGTGEFFELAEHIYKTALNINMPSVIMGVIALVILFVSKKIMPKFPMAVVLMFVGTIFTISLPINGVLIGIILSFTEMIIRTSKPSRCFLGIQPGHRHFRDLNEGSQIHAIEGVIIYRFSSNLFFGNIQVLQRDIEDSIKPDTKAVILDAGGVGSIDITAADRLAMLYKSLEDKGIRFYMTEHIAKINEQLRTLGLGYMIEEGRVRRTIHIALKDMGIGRPYPLEGGVENEERSASRKRVDNKVQEFVWAYGAESEEQIEKQIVLQIQQLKKTGDMEKLFHGSWSHMDAFDEDEWLEHLEEHLKEIVNISGKDEKTIAERFEKHREEIHRRIRDEHPEMAERFKERRHVLDEHLKEKHPEVFKLIENLRENQN